MENKTITIEQLAEKLGKSVWSKGDLKRIYLNDVGYNTKKMSTKAFIFQDENKDFKVSCYIDCPSQPYQWIKSQEEEVKEGIYNDIKKVIWEIENPERTWEEREAEIQSEIEKKELISAQNEFLHNLKKTKEGWKSEYARACERNNEYLMKMQTYEALSDDEKFKNEELEKEYKEIFGTSGSSKRRSEIDKIIIRKPIPLNEWMSKAVTFATEDEYADWKENELRNKLGL